jgi:hypothetical protein
MLNKRHCFVTIFEPPTDAVIASLVDDGNIGTPAVMSNDTLATVFCGVPGFHGCVVIDMHTVVFTSVYMFSLSEHCL